MVSGLTFIKKDFSPDTNFWDLNPHLIYIEPFNDLYNSDLTEDKFPSSKHMWCIFWLSDPDEEINKYLRTPEAERLDILKRFNPEFDEEHPIIKECLAKYPYLCLSADELAYKKQKDQLIKIAEFLDNYELNLSTVKELIDLKGKMPKLYTDYERLEKMFQKNKAETRVHGGRRQTARELGRLTPDA